MKMIKILQAVSLFAILIIAVSCRSSRPSGRTYPRDYPSNPYPDYPRRDYPVYRGSNPNPQNLPPGQAKKIYGGKSAKVYAPGQRKKYGYRHYPLIVIRTPDIIIRRYNDGRYYYKNSDGFMYWRGYDDRYYLDEKYLRDMDYDQGEYDDWKSRGRNNNSSQGQGRGNGHGNGHGNQSKGKGKGRN
jgi:hypothetical protein